MKLELKKFNMKCMQFQPGDREGRTSLFLAPRNRGKSFLLRDMLFHMRDLPWVVVISPTEGANEFFQKFVPGILIYEEYTPDIVEKFVKRQIRITKKYNDEKKKYGRSDIDPRAAIILDDMLYAGKDWVNDKNIKYLFLNGRHHNCTVALTSQSVLGIPPSLRTNLDNVFILKENITANRKKIYEQYCGIFPTYDVFAQVMTQSTQNYECLVVDNRSQGGSIAENVFWYKADPRDFRMCLNELWQIQAMEEERKSHQVDDDEDEEEDFNPLVGKRKNDAVIRVQKKGC